MAKTRKTAKQSSTSRAASDAASQADDLSASIGASAEQIWLAGVGAFGRAQVEGSRLFESLVKDGVGLEKTARSFAGERATEMRDAVESRVDKARGRASESWTRLEKLFEARVQRVLVTLGVPARDELDRMDARIDALAAKPRQNGRAATAKTPRKASVKKAAKAAPAKKVATERVAKTVAGKTTATQTAPRKATRKAATLAGTR